MLIAFFFFVSQQMGNKNSILTSTANISITHIIGNSSSNFVGSNGISISVNDQGINFNGVCVHLWKKNDENKVKTVHYCNGYLWQNEERVLLPRKSILDFESSTLILIFFMLIAFLFCN